MISYGTSVRLSRIFRKDTGKTTMLALDHGMALGPLRGLEDPRRIIQDLGSHVDSIMLNKGMLVQCADPGLGAAVVLRISGGATIAGPDITDERQTTSMEEALRLAADAVATSIFIGAASESASVQKLANLADECHAFGMPLLAVTAVGKDREKGFDAKYLALAVRVAAEMGADIIKTYYCPEGFDRVIQSALGVPVVIAGGPRMDSDTAVLETAYEAMEAGARGVDMGRNVWQSERPLDMLRALNAVVHEGVKARDAHARFFT